MHVLRVLVYLSTSLPLTTLETDAATLELFSRIASTGIVQRNLYKQNWWHARIY